MSLEDGSRSTMITGFPSGQLWVWALKILIRSAALRLAVVFAGSVTTANCFACTRHDDALTHTTSSSVRQSRMVEHSDRHPLVSTGNGRNHKCLSFGSGKLLRQSQSVRTRNPLPKANCSCWRAFRAGLVTSFAPPEIEFTVFDKGWRPTGNFCLICFTSRENTESNRTQCSTGSGK